MNACPSVVLAPGLTYVGSQPHTPASLGTLKRRLLRQRRTSDTGVRVLYRSKSFWWLVIAAGVFTADVVVIGVDAAQVFGGRAFTG